MKLVADENIPYVVEAFSKVGDVIALPTPQITNAVARQADALVIRNETQVNEELLRETSVRFVASATAGTDHVDFGYLAANEIGFANAPACNANSVKEFFLAALLSYAVRKGISLRGKTLGVIGVGAIGSKVKKVAEGLGMSVFPNDPPRARTAGNSFVALEDVLSSDFITVHTPLTNAGPDATYHLFNDVVFDGMRNTSVLINTARGAVVETAALKRALRQAKIADALIDVWEDEPVLDADLVSQCALATAHVAGYSMEGKLAAVGMVRDAVCQFFSIRTAWDSAQHLPPVPNAQITSPAGGASDEAVLNAILRCAYDIDQDDQRLRAALAVPTAQRVGAYTRLRTGYPSRREFSSYTVTLRREHEHLRPLLSALGFRCAPAQVALSAPRSLH